MFNFIKRRKAKHFDNLTTEKHEIHYTRYIASWMDVWPYYKDRSTRETVYGKEFVGWLTSLGLNEEEISNIKELATCGKMELERSADKYLKKSYPWSD